MAPRETKNNVYAKFWGDKQRALWYRPFATSHSRGTQPPSWRAKVALGQDKQDRDNFKW